MRPSPFPQNTSHVVRLAVPWTVDCTVDGSEGQCSVSRLGEMKTGCPSQKTGEGMGLGYGSHFGQVGFEGIGTCKGIKNRRQFCLKGRASRYYWVCPH